MKQSDVTVVGINDLLEVKHLAYLLKYDSVHGNYDGTIEVVENDLVVDGHRVRITAERNPEDIAWDAYRNWTS
jgi:glyceraldehyde 3-phosphate dehydrogenase